MPKEGDIRVNPDTKQVETLTPEGVWSAQAMEQQMSALQKNVSGVTKQIQEQFKLPPTIASTEVKDSIGYNGLPYAPPESAKKTMENIDGNVSSVVALNEEKQKKIDEQQTALDAQMSAEGQTVVPGQSRFQTLINFLKGKPTIDSKSVLETEQQKYDVPGLLTQTQEQNIKVASLKQDIETLKLDRQKEIDAARAQMGSIPTYIVDRQVEQINRTYDSKQAYKSAIMAGESALLLAYQNNLTDARAMVEDAVNAYTFDQQQKRQDFDNLFNVYGDWINSLEKDEQDVLNNARQDAIRAEENARQDVRDKLNLILDAAKNGLQIGSFNSLKDLSVEDITKLVSDAQKDKAERPSIFGSAGGGYYQQVYNPTTNRWDIKLAIPGTGGTDEEGGYTFTNTQKNAGAANAGMTMSEFNALDGEVKNFFIQNQKVQDSETGETFTYSQWINESFGKVENGEATKDEFKNDINNLNIPPQVKNYLLDRLDAIEVTETEKPGILQSIGNWFNDMLERGKYYRGE